jgi:hypothetical protein
MADTNSPHRILLTVLAEVHELLPSNQCRGIIVHKDRRLLQLDGQDFAMTIRKLNDLLQEIENKCQLR